jgi:hypothetical protein
MFRTSSLCRSCNFASFLSTTSTSQPSKNLFRLQERQREEEHKIRALAKQKETESLKIFLPEIEAKKKHTEFLRMYSEANEMFTIAAEAANKAKSVFDK